MEEMPQTVAAYNTRSVHFPIRPLPRPSCLVHILPNVLGEKSESPSGRSGSISGRSRTPNARCLRRLANRGRPDGAARVPARRKACRQSKSGYGRPSSRPVRSRPQNRRACSGPVRSSPSSPGGGRTCSRPPRNHPEGGRACARPPRRPPKKRGRAAHAGHAALAASAQADAADRKGDMRSTARLGGGRCWSARRSAVDRARNPAKDRENTPGRSPERGKRTRLEEPIDVQALAAARTTTNPSPKQQPRPEEDRLPGRARRPVVHQDGFAAMAVASLHDRPPCCAVAQQLFININTLEKKKLQFPSHPQHPADDPQGVQLVPGQHDGSIVAVVA